MKCIEIQPGEVFGRLMVIEKAGVKKRHLYYNCICVCGKEVITRGSALKNGNTESCGCKGRDQIKQLHLSKRIDGLRDVNGKVTVEYDAWRHIRARCYRKTNPKYKNYGGRGIRVCDRWIKSFTNFLSDMGNRPPHCSSIDRINVNGHYEPDNCRWATEQEQAVNKTNTVRIDLNGVEYCQASLARKIGVSVKAIQYHLDLGKSGIEIV